MAKRSGVDVAFFLVDGLSLLGDTSELSDDIENVFDEAKPLGEAWPKPTPTGDKMAMFAQQGWFNAATHATHEAFNGQGEVNRVLVYGFSRNVIGRPFSGFEGIYSHKYVRKAPPRNQLTLANAEYSVTGKAEKGVILHALGTKTADGNTEASSVDRNAETTVPVKAITSSSVANPTVITTPRPHRLASTQKAMIAGHAGSTPSINGERVVTVTGPYTFTVPLNVTVGGTGGTVKPLTSLAGGAAYLQLTALTLGGHTALAVSVYHSQDNVTFVLLVAFTARTTIGGQRQPVAGTVYRHLAELRDFTGAGSSPSATFMVGFARA